MVITLTIALLQFTANASWLTPVFEGVVRYVRMEEAMNKPIILLVEDNADDEELTRLALQQANVTASLVVARDGMDALNWLFGKGQHADRAEHVKPTLILLDLKLPLLSGLEVLDALRADERTRRVPVVMLTSSKEDADVIRAYNIGANSYIQKPIHYDQFQEAIDRISLYWLKLNKAVPH